MAVGAGDFIRSCMKFVTEGNWLLRSVSLIGCRRDIHDRYNPQRRQERDRQTDHHLAIEQGRAKPGRDPQEVVAAHVRRLEALRRAGIVERVAEGLWKMPDDLAEQGRRHDAQRLGGVAVELKSHLPIERQARVIGATCSTSN
jgi:hypothetical protein